MGFIKNYFEDTHVESERHDGPVIVSHGAAVGRRRVKRQDPVEQIERAMEGDPILGILFRDERNNNSSARFST